MVYILLADGFEDIEALAPLDILRRMGADVKTVGVKDKAVISARGVRVEADITADAVDMEKCEMLILPGGPGYEILDGDENADKFLRYAYEKGIFIGAICAAPSILGKRGMLEGKCGTCFTGYDKYCIGMIYKNEKAVRDGNIITSRGAGTALEFGYMLGAALFGEDAAENMMSNMLYK